jgi:hypothetical protein
MAISFQRDANAQCSVELPSKRFNYYLDVVSSIAPRSFGSRPGNDHLQCAPQKHDHRVESAGAERSNSKPDHGKRGCKMSDHNTYWFPAKRYGWGWGLPTAWQGWVVMGIFVFLILAGAITLLPNRAPSVFIAYSVVLSIALIAVCWLKGEPPGWNRGKQ